MCTDDKFRTGGTDEYFGSDEFRSMLAAWLEPSEEDFPQADLSNVSHHSLAALAYAESCVRHSCLASLCCMSVAKASSHAIEKFTSYPQQGCLCFSTVNNSLL